MQNVIARWFPAAFVADLLTVQRCDLQLPHGVEALIHVVVQRPDALPTSPSPCCTSPVKSPSFAPTSPIPVNTSCSPWVISRPTVHALVEFVPPLVGFSLQVVSDALTEQRRHLHVAQSANRVQGPILRDDLTQFRDTKGLPASEPRNTPLRNVESGLRT